MDRYVGMRTFVAVAQATSFTAAAGELGISASLVSRHIAAIENDVGVQLIQRTPRSVRLTEAGAEYAIFAQRVLAEIEETHARLARAQHADDGKISVISPKWIGLLDLGKAVADYLEEHPRTQIHFELGGVSDRIYDFVDRGFDVAFHARKLRDSRVKVRRITELEFVLAAAPDYLERHGTPQSLRELTDHACHIHTSDAAWQFDGELGQNTVKVVNPSVSTNAYAVIQDLLASGRGIGILPRRLAAGMLNDGELVEVLPRHRVQSRALYAVHGPGKSTPERVLHFLDFMVQWFQTHDGEAAAAMRHVA